MTPGPAITRANFSEAERVFHYTSAAGLFGILDSSCLWATHFQFLNDTKEFHAAREILKSLFKHEILSVLAAAKVNKDVVFNDAMNLRDFSGESSEDFLETFYQGALLGMDPFVFSLFVCSREDTQAFSEGVLQHWSTYGRAGGYAVQFDPVKLQDRLEESAATAPHSGINFEKIAYVNGDTLPASLAGDFRAIKSIIRDLTRCMVDQAAPPAGRIDQSYLPFIKIMSGIKSNFFSIENEARIV